MLKKIYVSILKIYFIFPSIVIGSIYEFAVFENFENTIKIFDVEVKIATLVEKIREHISYRMRYMNELMANDEFPSAFSLKPVLRLLNTLSKNCNISLYMKSQLSRERKEQYRMRVLRNNIMALDIKYPLSIEEILGGALRGLIVLHETYDLHLTHFIRGGLLNNDSFSKSRQKDSLKADDLALMAIEAFKLKWYDNSIKYINLSTNSINEVIALLIMKALH